MRYTRFVVVLLAALVAFPSVASAAGPSGSTDDGQVKCKKGAKTPVLTVYAGTNGVELCSDDNKAPDGRIIVSTSGRYVAADGDKTNPGPSSGFIRVDSKGVSCGGGKKTDASKRGVSCQPSPPAALPVP